MEDTYIVSKSNMLITANYDLSLEEQKIILTLASMVQPEDEEFKPYRFHIKDFIKLLGVSTKTKYTDIPKITKELMKKVFEIREENMILQLAWLSSARYELGSGMVELKISPDLKPYMLSLQKFYTSYKLKNILQLKSKYSIRIYEILKSHEFKKKPYILFKVEDIKGMIKCNYKLYGDMKRKVILKAQKELKEKTDINFEFEEIKTGRKVTAIKFYIYPNKKVEDLQTEKEICATVLEDPEEKELIKYVQAIFKEEITELEAKKMLSIAEGNIDIIKEKYEIAQSTPNIKNLVAWLIKAIKDDYKMPKEKIKSSSFNDFEQRNYDFNKLENELLGLDTEEESEEEYNVNFKQSTNDKKIDKLDVNLVIEQIKKLGDLQDLGLLTKEEFETKKRTLLGKIN